MTALKHGIRGFLRGGWTSLVIALLFFVSALAVMISTLVLDVCDIYRSKTEDPYSDYFRLVVDQEGAVMAVDAGSRDYQKGPEYQRSLHSFMTYPITPPWCAVDLKRI